MTIPNIPNTIVKGIPWRTQNSMGRIPPLIPVSTTASNSFGTGAPATTYSMVWQSPTIEPLHMTAHPVQIRSTSGQDTFGGNGWWQALVSGLNDNFELISEIVNMNGTNFVNTIQSYKRVIKIRSAGPNSSSVGVISARQAVTLEFMGQSTVTTNQISKVYYPIPRGYYGLVRSVQILPQSLNIYDAALTLRSPNQANGTLLMQLGHVGTSDIGFVNPIIVPPTYEVYVLVRYPSGGFLNAISANLDMVLVKEDLVNEDFGKFSPILLSV